MNSKNADNRTHLTLGHSPDPDDAFMFYGLAKGLVDGEGFIFEHILQDIETLNRRALRTELDVTAISLHAYAAVLDRYALLPCGASIGDGYGPMVVSREPLNMEDLKRVKIAVPGTLTTAYLALRICIGEFDHAVLPFDRIIEAVAGGQYEAGLIIHEGQLTYQKQGLHRVADLGAWWKRETSLPLPLGANVVKKSLGAKAMRTINRVLRNSIQYGLDHRENALAHALQYARDMDTRLADRFVGMYVNDFTLDFGEVGKRGVSLLLERGYEAGVISKPVALEFVA